MVALALIGGGAAYLAVRDPGHAAPRPDANQTTATSPVRTTGPTAASTTTAPTHVGTSAPFVGTETAAWVAAENSKPGTRDWQLTRPATGSQIAGYANAVSIDVGGSVLLYVSTTAPTYQIEAFRMGWYAGNEGRQVWTDRSVSGVRQAACNPLPTTDMVSCSWVDPVFVSTAGWPPGDYLFKLQSAAGWQSYIALTIRDDASHSAYLINNSVTTWQAYNNYGGYDLYQGPNNALATRSSAVSFDRPYVLGNGAGDFLGLELPMISMMESRSLDVSYTTDIDVAEHSGLLRQHKAFISLGHDEYYSLSMRQGLLASRDAGVNLVFLGANAIYRHIRLTSSPLGADRVEIDYKNAQADPLNGIDNADVTPWAWRDPPNNAPESVILGEMWQCNPVRADMVITDPSYWMFAGTGFVNGSHIAGIVGPEYDHFASDAPNPGDVTVVAVSPVVCGGKSSTANMTYYSAPSGAGVWDTGTIDWVGQVAGSCPTCAITPVTRVTENVLADFGQGPAGVAHPSQANMG